VIGRLARRLWLLAAVEVWLVLVAVILVGALLAFGAYVRSLSAEMQSTRGRLSAVLQQSTAAQRDARAAATAVAREYLPPAIAVIVLDASRRVVVYRAHRTDTRPVVTVRSRGDLSGEPRASSAGARLVAALGTAFGLESLHAHAGNVYLIVTSNDAVLASAVQPFMIAVVAALLLATLCAALVARTLTRQTTLPLQEAFAQRDAANAAMRQFIADAGHQLRTPLTVVQGFIDIMRRGGGDDAAERERILGMMSRQSRIMGALIDKLILLERWQHADGQPAEPIDVGVLVADLAAPLANAHPERRLDVSTEPGLLAAIDPTELGYVVNNLLDNALKYTGGEIDVLVRGDARAVTIEVRDRGPGLEPAEAPRIFDRFYRGAQRDVEGSGLGLAIAKRAVERAHGSISVESSRERGSRFVVRLPRARYPAGANAASGRAGGNAKSS
jgi:signal transduction histidine kinase